MNAIIYRIKRYAEEKPDDIAYIVYDESRMKADDSEIFTADSMTWKELNEYSDNLAAYITNHTKKHEPLIVYGHKNRFMIACFIACVKAGHAYIPVDVSVPVSRVQDIVDSVEPEIILATEDCDFVRSLSCEHLGLLDIERISGQSGKISEDVCLKPEDTFYIIFTSGSTGKPKGVKITTECLTNYVKWAQTLGSMENSDNSNCSEQSGGYRFLNQAPFSFDLSVMDVYLSLYTGGTICAITKDVQKSLKLLYKVLLETDVNVWVSTPSFVDVCLSDRIFNKTLLPNLKYFLFCGETLLNKTAKRLRENFNESTIVNTYGPTESTVCVTEVTIDDDMLNTYNPLPVGSVRPGTWLYIIDENGKRLSDGEQGEIIIVGDTVSTGYYKNPEQTNKVFSTEIIDAIEYRLYHTGDKGYIKDGQLFYCGRIVFQIKLHGYRIEIEDIENNLIKIRGVEKAVVLPNMEDNRVKSLTAYVI